MDLTPIATHPKIEILTHALRVGESLLMEELWDSPKALCLALAQKMTGKHVLVLTGASQEENRIFHDLQFFSDCPVVDFPAWETLPNENLAPSPDVVGDRYQILQNITQSNTPHIVISNLHACLQKLIPRNRFNDLFVHLKVGETYDYELLILHLTEMGYEKNSVASDKGQFAMRGGIVDVFPVSSTDPCRIEFLGETIESIRLYDPVGQKSVSHVKEIAITPAKEMELLGQSQELETILDYLGPNTLIIFDDLLALEDRYTDLIHICGKPTRTFWGIDDFLNRISGYQSIYWSSSPVEEISEVTIEDSKTAGFYSKSRALHRLSFSMFNRTLKAARWRDPFISIASFLAPNVPEPTGEDILSALGKFSQSDYQVHIVCQNPQERFQFEKRLAAQEVSLSPNTTFDIGYLSSGFALDEWKTFYFPLTEITHRYKIRRQKQRSTYHTTPSEVFALAPGDMVVHLQNGIGRYLGIDTKPNHLGVMTEFMKIEYADKAQLFVPLNQSYLISKYVGSNDSVPTLHEIGGKKWKKTREQTEIAIQGYAKDLLRISAEREIRGGLAFPQDTLDMVAFEEEFPYVETEDQLRAIHEIKEDMQKNHPMDRLVCGDVGYGKTEVAMRAAFKAALEGGKQVAVLVPTTVLAMQHFDNFTERMANFPVNISVLSRFRTPKQTRETLEGVKNGTVDVLIGTHRIISKDVVFKDLGLLIVDEEQRFGVRAKEALKRFKANIDCLTLSATPIPRTLYMSLIGVRGMSVINTPPQDRLPITTIISESNDEVIKSALLRELTRDGQAFIIHNRVETIFEFANRIKSLLPKARIVVGHGQMDADELDLVFHTFKSGQADILVATSIIENGIDIPNANTIIVDRADRFGLSDLYQIRGRVGRWNRRAYAYLLVPNRSTLPEISRKRLQALAEASGYGGGMKVAMHDLEIRGAGDIIGTEQSGHVSAIGFHFYCKLLKRTIRSLQGKISSNVVDVRIDFPIDARIPEDYVDAASLRMEIYQRLGEALSLQEVTEIWEELKDRFGSPPAPVLWLYHLSRIRVHASLNGFSLLRWDKKTLTIEYSAGKYKDKPLIKTTSFPYVHGLSPQEMENKIIKLLTPCI